MGYLCGMIGSYTHRIQLLFLWSVSSVVGILGQSPQYTCNHAVDTLTIDGVLSEESWFQAPWTQLFIDIEGERKPKPSLDTKVKMVWDEKYLYIGAELEDPHVWATLEGRDEIIYHDNDFEVFIDPDGDKLFYYEIEINANNAVMDLLMTRPYYMGGRYIMSMNMEGLKHAVHVEGTLNHPQDHDKGWTVEMAIPMKILCEQLPKKGYPQEEDQWRVNFSRVQWDTDIVNGRYLKNNNPEHNWVWSPTGKVDIHRPQRWGYVRFSLGNGKK